MLLNKDTRIEGTLLMGARVLVDGVQQEDSAILAESITVVAAPPGPINITPPPALPGLQNNLVPATLPGLPLP